MRQWSLKKIPRVSLTFDLSANVSHLELLRNNLNIIIRKHWSNSIRSRGGQSRDTHVVFSHVLFTLCARLNVCLTIIFLVFGLSAEMTTSAEYLD